MKRALLFIACVLASISMQADKTEINEQNFPDKNFRNYVLSTAVDRNQNNILDDDEILRVTNIDVHQKGIVSLKGIEYFTELQKLTCYQNNLTELDLSACTKLDFLNCASNKLTSLNLSGCAKLEWIRCDGNQLPELDVSACTELDTLVCSANKISTLDVSACTKLDYLNCQYINISKLDVSNNTELVTLYCDMNHLTELDLSKNTKLEVCTCSGNGMTKLILSKDNVLNYLGCSTNKLYGAAMEHIVENLNYQQQGGSLHVFNAEDKDSERNVITTKQVEALNAKGWQVYQWIYSWYCLYKGIYVPDYYRPMIEDGKVWKVGSTMIRDNVVKFVGYYYFDGDTIIGGKTCKKMMRQRYVTPDYPDYAIVMQYPLLEYMGAWYEEDKKVYFYNPKRNKTMMYDFSLDTDDTFMIYGYGPYGVGPRLTGGLEGFKGVYRDLLWYIGGSRCTTWLEGVGGIDGPTVSVYYGYENHPIFLMSCTVGDEVIYLNDEYEDVATPGDNDAKKGRFDFTHTVKEKPRAPTRGEAEASETKSLYGEYTERQLSINLNPLDDAYSVCITDETGKTVYEKDVNASNIVGLNIDISAYTEGRYTVTMENSHETYTGEFEVQTTGISLTPALSQREGAIYNLQGQRLKSLQKGLNIVNGRKFVVK